MHLDFSERRVTLSVGEFAEFRLGPVDLGSTRTGRWRAELGQAWHKELQVQAEAEYDELAFEVPLKGTYFHKNWAIRLQGRVDQLIDNSRAKTLTLREIKTVRAALPQEERTLKRDYYAYFNQLAAYLVLAELNAAWSEKAIQGELIFVDIAEGKLQTVPLGADYQAFFIEQLEELYGFIEHRWESQQRRRQERFLPPFTHVRPGQEQVSQTLTHLGNRAHTLLFEAPTGFGKTGTLLEFALEGLRQGLYSRLLYLTGKSTGQLQVIRQIEAMLPPNNTLHYWQMRSKAEHAITSPLHTCEEGLGCQRGLKERWEEAGLVPRLLYEGGTLTIEQVKALGSRTGVCPYEISRALLPLADLWVGDYNYVFAPRNQGIFFNQPGFDPAQTLLIVDEAHNLSARVAEAFSHRISTLETETVLSELSFTGIDRSLFEAYDDLGRFLQAMESTDRLELTCEYELADLLEAIIDVLQKSHFDPDHLSPSAFDKLWKCYELRDFLTATDFEKLLWSPQSGTLHFSCLSAAPAIAATLESFRQVVMVSATLSPPDLFLQSCGLSSDSSQYFCAQTPWRTQAYEVAIDTRVDTRFKMRERYYSTTAETIHRLCRCALSPVAVFFPSYRYAETIGQYLEAAYPELQLALQPRGRHLADQHGFIEEALGYSHALFLILGSSFAESIDGLGGRVTHTMVVGPALPEVNALQRARMEACAQLPRTESFRQVYQVPAMRKINQALGRLVRAPGQEAKVLLHCRRFHEPSYRALLAPEYRRVVALNTPDDLQAWLARSR